MKMTLNEIGLMKVALRRLLLEPGISPQRVKEIDRFLLRLSYSERSLIIWTPERREMARRGNEH